MKNERFFFQLFSFFIVALETFVIVKYRARGYTSNNTVTIFKGVSFYTHIWFAILLYAAEIVFNIILLVGAHTVCSYYLLSDVSVLLMCPPTILS